MLIADWSGFDIEAGATKRSSSLDAGIRAQAGSPTDAYWFTGGTETDRNHFHIYVSVSRTRRYHFINTVAADSAKYSSMSPHTDFAATDDRRASPWQSAALRAPPVIRPGRLRRAQASPPSFCGGTSR